MASAPRRTYPTSSVRSKRSTLLSADPGADINNAKAIAFVMKNGEVIDDSKLPLAGGKQPRRFSSSSRR